MTNTSLTLCLGLRTKVQLTPKCWPTSKLNLKPRSHGSLSHVGSQLPIFLYLINSGRPRGALRNVQKQAHVPWISTVHAPGSPVTSRVFTYSHISPGLMQTLNSQSALLKECIPTKGISSGLPKLQAISTHPTILHILQASPSAVYTPHCQGIIS